MNIECGNGCGTRPSLPHGAAYGFVCTTCNVRVSGPVVEAQTVTATIYDSEGREEYVVRRKAAPGGGKVSAMKEGDWAMARFVRYYSHPDCPA